MAKVKTFLLLLIVPVQFLAQGIPKAYYVYTKSADSLYKAKKYKESAFTYSKAFHTNGGKGLIDDRYKAACVWTLANYPDSAIFNLDRIISKGYYTNYQELLRDKDFEKLYNDERWKLLVKKAKENSDKIEAKINRPVKEILDSIHNEDQNYRIQIDYIENKYGRKSKAMDSLWRIIRDKDSSNLITVAKIIDKYGWLGADEVGQKANSTLFLVIQHSDQRTQEKYLPVMREAVKNGKAYPGSLALLEDRVGLGQGKKQVYGSQVGRDPETGAYYVLPLEDPDNVNKRRSEMGLPALEKYLEHWQIKWDSEQYKKDLPAIEAKRKR
jgi:hypothetical protein